ncbi:NACHT domain-containing protein [Streptomyces griseiscabiei]|uniref:NACHT domain-containing protein n=1 Tax=Streptomyces griseiscabiei TaxID=2993540 RepID=A0ABU4L8Y9_9ACTN|nr:NACHT domain-containing protein [Streptomyces griseiscabiei]MBZ3903464.1 NACHT domain-containing protein [Streptomyces griseiscabiei]MDX2912207.1 NACHT domain-containing protein [Streptomyces griseiscabiei]
MPDPITTGVVSAAGSAAGRAAGPLLLGGVRSRLERRAIKKRTAEVEFHGTGEVEQAIVDISMVDREKTLKFMRSAEFENLCFQVAIAGCMPENPDSHLQALKETFEISLRRYAGVADSNIKMISQALFTEIVSISWREVNRHQKESGIAKRALTPEIISSHIASAARNAEIHRKLADLSEVDLFSVRLSRQSAKVHGRIRPAQTESGARVAFESLYVPPNLKLGEEDDEGPSDVRNLLKQTTRLVILGDPGGGKTTLALKLTLDVARGLGTGSALQTPLRVVLREYASHYKANQESIIRFLEKQSEAVYSTPASEGAIEYLLLNGRAVVVFDGLDELTDTSLRETIVDIVEAFAHAYPTTPILVTSRRVGYEMAPLDENMFAVAQLSPFGGMQKQEYVQKWFSQVKGSVGDGDMSTRFLVESSHASDLTSNPLMLGLMCALYRGEGYIPRNRPDLYRRCSEFLFERWDASRGISVQKPFEQGIRFAMFSLALSMLDNSGSKGGMTERELIRYTSDYLLGQQYEDRDSADAAAEAFVQYCRGRAWVLTDVGTNPDGERIYSFTHRTFLEYFSARQLVRDSGGADALYVKLRDHLIDESWDVTSQLAVQFLDERLGDAANDFVRLALNDARGLENFKQKTALISFCARLLEFMALRPAIVREIVSELQVTCSLRSPARRVSRQDTDALVSAWSGVSMCTPEMRGVAVDELLNFKRDAQLSYHDVTWQISMVESVPHHASSEVRDFWSQQDLRSAREINLAALARTDKRAAAAAVLFGLLEVETAISWHGASVATIQGISPHTGRRGSHNLISELAYPRKRWNYEERERISGDVINKLMDAQTPWMYGEQSFNFYSMELGEDKNMTACMLLSWMLGIEMEFSGEDSPERDSEDGESNYADTHALFASVAEMRRNGSHDHRFDSCSSELDPQFRDFVLRWARSEFSLSTPEDA